MKPSLLLKSGLGSGLFLGICVALYCQQTQKASFNHVARKHHTLQKELEVLKNDLDFLKKNHNHLHDLIKKGWLLPQNRLIAGEKMNQWGHSLNAVRFTIEPESIKEIESKYFFKVSKIIIEIDALFDNNIYEFTRNILKNFPGVLILRTFSIGRQEEVNTTNLLALREKRRPNFVVGEIICEWVSMEIEKHEEH